jgi:hypothetical protein
MGEDGVIRSINTEEVTEKDVRDADQKVREMVKKIPYEERRLLVDFRRTRRTSPKARRIYADAAREGIFPKSAVLVSTPYQKVLTLFVLRATRAKGIRVFDKEEEALKWLRE